MNNFELYDTSNHIHLLVVDDGDRDAIPKAIQLVAGRTGQKYNQRKERKGAYWEDRYHATTALAREIAADRGIIETELRSGSRKRKVSEARRAFCRASVGELGYPAAAVARFLGVTTSAVVRAAGTE